MGREAAWATLPALPRNRRPTAAVTEAPGAGDDYAGQHSDEEQALLEDAERTVAEQAETTIDQAFWRIHRYARFHELSLSDVSRAVLNGSVRLLTVREDDNLTQRARGPDGEGPG